MENQKFIRLTPNEIEILQVLFSEISEVYGLAMFKQINRARKDYNFNKIGYGSFYAALKKLEREELIKSSTPEQDKRKKHYVITGLGEKFLKQNIIFVQYLALKIV